MHERARYPLTGSHRATPCVGCHQRRGRRTDLAPKASTCTECHSNPHGTRYAEQLASKGCAGCHTTGSWGGSDFDHSATAFPLRGRHAQIGCASCHDSPDSKPPLRCASCHGDPHLLQFTTEPVKRCDDCHSDTTWALPSPNHSEMTGWPLTGKHARVACAACHPTATRVGGSAVRYRLGPTECETCHANPHRRRRTP